MYVTDVPVHERLTNRPLAEIRSALDELQFRSEDLYGWQDHARQTVLEAEEPAEPVATLRGLCDATEAVLTASDDMAEALSLLGIDTF